MNSSLAQFVGNAIAVAIILLVSAAAVGLALHAATSRLLSNSQKCLIRKLGGWLAQALLIIVMFSVLSCIIHVLRAALDANVESFLPSLVGGAVGSLACWALITFAKSISTPGDAGHELEQGRAIGTRNEAREAVSRSESRPPRQIQPGDSDFGHRIARAVFGVGNRIRGRRARM